MIAILLAAFLSGNYTDPWGWFYVGDHPKEVGACLNEFGFLGDPQWAEQRIWVPKSAADWCIKWNTPPKSTPIPRRTQW